MKKLVTPIISLALTTATAAQAATIYTPALVAENGGEHSCSAVNVSTKEREITVEVLSFLGNVIASAGPLTVAAGRNSNRAFTSSANRSYCRVPLKGGRNTVRVALQSRINETPSPR